jgi:hypothetical protein
MLKGQLINSKEDKMRLRTVLLIAIGALYLYGGDNFYQGDSFNKRHSKGKESFNKTMAKNRAYSHMGDASYTEVNGKDEFKKALEAGKFDQKIDSNKITKTYKAIDIKNVRMNRDDFKNIDSDRVLIGSEVDKDREKLMQTIDIKNSKIDTDKQLNIGVISKSDKIEGIDTITNIERSSLKGIDKKGSSKDISRLDMFEELERANNQ